MIRQQPPVYSPLTLRALASGLRAMFGADAAPRGRVERYLDERYAPRAFLLTHSGTAALTLAIRAALTRFPGRPVGLPAYSCYDLATSVEGARARALLYDIDPRTLGPDFDSFRSVLKEGPAAVVVAHLYGVPVDMDGVIRHTRESGTLLIEDAAQGSGASWAGQPLGVSGALGVLSFGRGKGVTAGEGGALLAYDRDVDGASLLAGMKAELQPAGRGTAALVASSAQWLLARPRWYRVPAAAPFLQFGETVYRTPRPLREMAKAASGLLAETLPVVEKEEKIRRRNASRLLNAVEASSTLASVSVPREGRAGYLRLPALARTDLVRRRVTSTAGIRLGIAPGYPRPLSSLPELKGRLVRQDQHLPGASDLADRLFTLPTHSRLGQADLRDLELWMRGHE